MIITCPHCKTPIELEHGKVPFRATCPSCNKDLHTCKGCAYYHPGKPNDCTVTGSLFVRDREAYNFCEDFSLKNAQKMEKDKSPHFQSLFKKEASSHKKSSFEDLFK